jgi:lipoprotein
MKKFKKAITLVIIAVPLLTACGDKDIFGTTYTFKRATVKLPNGEIVNSDVKEWAREDKTDSVRVTFKDGRTYFSSTVNVVLYND